MYKEDYIPTIRSAGEIEDIIVMVRLSEYNNAKPCGTRIIRSQLDENGVRPLPSLSTINRVLSKRSLTNGRTGQY